MAFGFSTFPSLRIVPLTLPLYQWSPVLVYDSCQAYNKRFDQQAFHTAKDKCHLSFHLPSAATS